MFTLKKFGDWAKAGIVLSVMQEQMKPHFEARLKESGEMFLEAIRDHINTQDLPWTPLSPTTVRLKGDDTIYFETGFLYENFAVRKIKSSAKEYTIFVGASPWVRTPSGEKLSDIMIWL